VAERHREFKAKRRDKPPVTFTLEGETFTCLPDPPGAVLTDFLGDASSDQPGRSAPALVNFITAVMVEEDVERFLAHVHSKEVVIEIETLGEIVTWLIEEYADRPTARPSHSVGGPPTTTPTSTGDSASLVSPVSPISRSAAR